MAKLKGTTQPVYAGLGSILVIVFMALVEHLSIEVMIMALGSKERSSGDRRQEDVPIQGDYDTVREAADRLGVEPVSIHAAIRRGTLIGEKKGPRLMVIERAELDRYQREHHGGQGWEKRKAPDYEPSTMAQWAREYRAQRTGAAPHATGDEHSDAPEGEA